MGRLNAGSLTERLELLTPSAATSDGQGGRVKGLATTSETVWGRVRILSANEVVRLGQTVGTTVAEFTIRYRPATTATQATWKGKTLGIRAVQDDPFKEFTTLTCVDNGRT